MLSQLKQTYPFIAAKQTGVTIKLRVLFFKLYWGMAFDRTAIEMETETQESGNKAAYYKILTWQDRLRIANYLNSIEYNYAKNNPPRMDKSVFSMKSLIRTET